MTDAMYFDSRSAIAAASDLELGPRRKSRSPLLSPAELAALRREAERDGAIYVHGKQGVTVFRFGLWLR